MEKLRRKGWKRVIEKDRDENCVACTKLKKIHPGRKCEDCREAAEWAAKQVEVADGEIELKPTAKTRSRCCIKCNESLTSSHYFYCQRCHDRLDKSEIDTQFNLDLRNKSILRFGGLFL